MTITHVNRYKHAGLFQLLGLICFGLLGLCSMLLLGKPSHAPAMHPVAQPVKPSALPVVAKAAKKHHWYQVGKASWYGEEFQGKRTATGESFDMHALTCAHRTLPLGSWLRVTNLHNKKSTLVRVNDRGPYVEDVMIDLSFAAAQKLHIFGRSKVKVEALNANDPAVLRARWDANTAQENPTSD